MEFLIKSNEKNICNIHIIDIDESMGVLEGQFTPFDNYYEYARVIKKYSKLAFSLNAIEADNDNEFIKLRKEIEDYNFKAFDENKNEIKFAHIELRDYSDQLGNEGFVASLYRV